MSGNRYLIRNQNAVYFLTFTIVKLNKNKILKADVNYYWHNFVIG